MPRLYRRRLWVGPLGFLVLGLMTLGILGTTGCSTPFARAPVIPPIGWLYQNTKAPLSVNYNKTEVNPGKTGSASTTYICGWPLIPSSSFSFDNASIEAAAKNGGLSEVGYADYEMLNVLGVYSKFTVHAYGK